MPNLNWDQFRDLPGDPSANFEAVARGAAWRNYARFGRFAELVQQPGVEFHLTIEHSACELGDPGRKFGWQTKWWAIPSGRTIGARRRQDVLESIETTQRHVPDCTDWVLWTRRPLTPADQEWFYGLTTGMQMHLWTEEHLEGLLIGDAQLLRESYFGDLVLTPNRLREMHDASAAEVGDRWLPDVHQQLEAESVLRRMLGEPDAWGMLADAAADIVRLSAAVAGSAKGLDDAHSAQVSEIVAAGSTALELLKEAEEHVRSGRGTVWLGVGAPTLSDPVPKLPAVLRRLRADQHPVAPALTNLVAHVRDAQEILLDIGYHLETRVTAVIGDAGYGKTQLAATLAARGPARPPGILLHGGRLGSRDGLDDLARQVSIAGRPAESFEKLLAAVDAAAVRAGCRLPVVIDGLNEAESASRWAPLLRRLIVTLEKYPAVLVVCTVRGAFVDEAIPTEVEDVLELTGFDESLDEAVKRYFTYYKIEHGDAELPLELVNHPLTLKILCQVTNPSRRTPVSADRLPGSLAAMFDAYLRAVGLRVAALRPQVAPHDIAQALDALGHELWSTGARAIPETRARELFGDAIRRWNDTILSALEHEGVLIRHRGETSGTTVAVVYDMLAGHIVASSLVRAQGAGIADILGEESIVGTFGGGWEDRHPLASDIFSALAAVMPAAGAGQLWQVVPTELKARALLLAVGLEPSYVDSTTVTEIARTVADLVASNSDLFRHFAASRAIDQHPLNVRFLDRILRDMDVASRDLSWTEWLRATSESRTADAERQIARWKTRTARTQVDALRARWLMWTLTSTDRSLRDTATEALYWFGRGSPGELFELAIDSLAINDAYVGERALAAAYGVLTAEAGTNPTVVRPTQAADAEGEEDAAAGSTVRHGDATSMLELASDGGDQGRIERDKALRRFLDQLVGALIGDPDGVAKTPTYHALTRYYAAGVLECARRFTPSLLPTHVTLPPGFAPGASITPLRDGDEHRGDIARSMRMDFRNYTLGRLFDDRRNYDDGHPGHRDVTDRVLGIVRSLGWTTSTFGDVDRAINAAGDHAPGRVERYGKKYSWIGFYLVSGLLADTDSVGDWLEVDIDPTFPQPSAPAPIALSTWTRATPKKERDWLDKGVVKVPDAAVSPQTLEGDDGPWILVHAEISCKDPNTGRSTYGLFNTVLVERSEAKDLVEVLGAIPHPGRDVIDVPSAHYCFAGEIPWHDRFAALEDGRSLEALYGGVIRDGTRTIAFESLAHDYAWESHYSSRNQASAWVPSKLLSAAADLRSVPAGFDQTDAHGRVASRSYAAPRGFSGHMLYVRTNVLRDYAMGRCIVTFGWGERRTQFVGGQFPGPLQRLYQAHRNVWRRVWTIDAA